MTKTIRLKSGYVFEVETDLDSFDDYLANVPTQESDGEIFFCPLEPQSCSWGKVYVWYPIEGASFV